MKISKNEIPMAVLSQKLGDKIGGRRVRAGIFTTFTYDPGFFELHVLPILFDQAFSPADKLRRIQLEDALRSVDNLAVYYDMSGLSQDAEPAQLDYRRISIRRNTGCFHPKVILLLVDNEEKEPEENYVENLPSQSLIVEIQSANLTRAGWWENIECSHFMEIEDREINPSPSSIRRDLLGLIQRIQKNADSDDNHSALEQIREFLLKQTPRDQLKLASYGGMFYTRIFYGQEKLSTWLTNLRFHRHDWNLEIISPFFDPTGAGPLIELIEVLKPKETRVYIPQETDGTARVTKQTYNEISEYAYWSTLPGEIMHRGRGKSAELLPPRNVHSKIYRLWNRNEGKDILLIGSVNLTESAHSHSGAGNLEASFLIDVSDEGYPKRWWLERLDVEKDRFISKGNAEEDDLDKAVIDISIRFDWGTNTLAYRLIEEKKQGFDVCETNGHFLFQIDNPRLNRWVVCGERESETIRTILQSTSFLSIKHAKGTWRIIVMEENMGYRPSLLMQLTPEEILEFWSLLTPEQRAAFIENRLPGDDPLLVDTTTGKLPDINTLFNRFSGIFHSFGCLQKYIEDAIEKGRPGNAEARFAGAKYDSLPNLLEKTLEKQDGDPVVSYVIFLCACQLYNTIKKKYPDFIKERRSRLENLQCLLEKLKAVRRKLLDEDMKKGKEFIEWYEEAFLNVATAEGNVL
tara:strand:- start:3381 stop:5447 length:2067 start_codon:yes stop_codon:yes gene_type:complete